jgi:hypothetical protein
MVIFNSCLKLPEGTISYQEFYGSQYWMPSEVRKWSLFFLAGEIGPITDIFEGSEVPHVSGDSISPTIGICSPRGGPMTMSHPDGVNPTKALAVAPIFKKPYEILKIMAHWCRSF